jgi:hypothetical protein
MGWFCLLAEGLKNLSGHLESFLHCSCNAGVHGAFEPPSLPGRIDLQECDASTLSVLLRIVESKAPPRVTLAQACNLFSAVEYCLADKLRDLLFDYLEPMIADLTAKEVCNMTPKTPLVIQVSFVVSFKGRCSQSALLGCLPMLPYVVFINSISHCGLASTTFKVL